MPDDLLNTADVARMHGVERVTVNNWIRKGNLPAEKIGGIPGGTAYRIKRSDAEAFVPLGRGPKTKTKPEEKGDIPVERKPAEEIVSDLTEREQALERVISGQKRIIEGLRRMLTLEAERADAALDLAHKVMERVP